MLTETADGLYCEDGSFFIDPWQPVERALITHAHGDHARIGHARYLAARDGEHVLRARLGAAGRERSLDFSWSSVADQVLDVYEKTLGVSIAVA